jgi:hypothetical protein
LVPSGAPLMSKTVSLSGLGSSRRSLEDRFNLNTDRLVFHELERVLREIIGMKVQLEELVRRTMCVPEQIVEHVLFHGRVAAHSSGVTDERGDLVALHALDRRGTLETVSAVGIVMA